MLQVLKEEMGHYIVQGELSFLHNQYAPDWGGDLLLLL
jgi:hypothetical protein